ncbi:MAG TPA: TIGR02234 family membrane protein [Mycobacterium sp.]|nr:TIGR02234 family membrane protein [Mycobacterium sp.]
MTRVAQLLLVLSALGLWVASRMPWVDVTSFDGLGQPKSTTLNGASWSTALVPLALVVLAAAVAALAVRGWVLRLVGALVAVATVGMGYLGIGLWVIRDVAVRAADLAQIPITALIGTQRHHGGAVLTLAAAVCALAGSVLLVRSAARVGTGGAKAAGKYLAPAAKREAARQESSDDGMSERMIWDALDEGRDPTTSDNEGR